MENYTTVKARLLVNLYLKTDKCDLETAKEYATNYCDTIIYDLEEFVTDNIQNVVSFYLLIKHEISKIDAPF